MQRLKNSILRFMYGRRGVDKLGIVILVTGLILAVVNSFLGSRYLSGVVFALEVVFLYRALSKNWYKRQRECDLVFGFFGKVGALVKLFFCRVRDIFRKRYRKCTYCKAVLRLPIKRGTHTVNCPRCKRSFTVKIIL